jgi:O-antigen/teichoic acid export membrane protein
LWHTGALADAWGGTRPGEWAEFAGVWRFSLLAMLGSVISMPGWWLSTVILANQPGGVAALGLFNAAEKWRQVMLFLPASLSTLFVSLLSSLHGAKHQGGYRKVVLANLAVNLAVVGSMAVALSAFSPAAMGIFGEDFRDGSGTLIILALAAVAQVLNDSTTQILVSRGLMGWRTTCNIVFGVLVVLFSLWLVPTYLDKGLALALLLALGVAAFLLRAGMSSPLAKERAAEPAEGGPAGQTP